ncbi:protein obstructor-E-like [Leptidea sinapis]|uniref:protein obstructor-E-like n=1 Tax=Leptidea sinapis TaxID=189913 RepID=UPI0021432EF2|nr:protein obstructor-E-like [Leptidea sinapis]
MIAVSITFLLLLSAAYAEFYHGVDPNSLECDPRGEVFLLLPHFTNCSKFFTCVHGAEVEMECAPGTIFDFPLQTCNHLWATGCHLREKNEIDGSGEEEFVGFSQQLETPLSGVVSRSASASPSDALLKCNDAESASSRLPYIGDCQRYVRCSNGSPQTLYCSDGLFFNAHTQQCDFEANVKCTDEQLDELGSEFIVYK